MIKGSRQSYLKQDNWSKENTMVSPKSGRERRKHHRLSIILALEYQSIFDSCFRTGLLANLSDTGLLFHCRGDMSVGTTLTMTVMFADGFALTSFEVRARIIWKDLHFDRDWREYKYGAEFTYISEDAKQKLNRLITAYSSEEKLKNNRINSIRDNHTHPVGSQTV